MVLSTTPLLPVRDSSASPQPPSPSSTISNHFQLNYPKLAKKLEEHFVQLATLCKFQCDKKVYEAHLESIQSTNADIQKELCDLQAKAPSEDIQQRVTDLNLASDCTQKAINFLEKWK